MTNNKQKHIAYWKKQGRFVIDCDTDAFNDEEIEILEKWGNWFKALCDEKLIPINMMQERFVRVHKRELEPISIEESAWIKYHDTKKMETKPGDAQNKEFLPPEDTFYSREMYKKNRRVMFGVMNENHRN